MGELLSSGDKYKIKSVNIYCSRSHIKYYTFINSVRTILSLLKLLSLIKFRL